uniref:Uncharacterized protein n=1 Tax=Acrobeloides nanus TaxID=290746 RepID=A0A914BUA6_9BILA
MQQPSLMHVLPPQPASCQSPPSYASASGSAAFDAEKIWGTRLKDKKYKKIDSRVDRDPNYYKRIHFRLSKTIP